MKYISILLIVSIVTVGCKSSKKEVVNEEKVKEVAINVDKPTDVQSEPAPVDLSEKDCYYPRKTIRTITEESGSILLIDKTYVIVSDVKGRYQPCEMPDEYQVDGKAVIFSGDKLEIFPNERRMASPFRLTSLSSK